MWIGLNWLRTYSNGDSVMTTKNSQATCKHQLNCYGRLKAHRTKRILYYVISDFGGYIIIIIIIIIALQTFVGPWLRFQFLHPKHSLSRGSYMHTEQHKHRIKVHRHPCLEWDSNPRS
jgi:hypothetical protein